MKCKTCGATGRVYLDRLMTSGNVYRRRRCPKCKAAWTTIEIRRDDLAEIFEGMIGAAQALKDSIKGS